MVIVSAILGIVSLVCWILVLIKMFTNSIVQGIIGLICPLWALIWGWMNREDGLGAVMPVWTLVVIISVVLNVMLRPH